jgi:hypothetical protein
MNKTAIVLLMVCALVASVSAQKKMKPWTEWSEKDAQKILDNSPWGQTQVETDISEMFYSPTTQGQQSRQGALNQATPTNFRIRFLSAKPIRQAFARVMEAQQKQPNPQLSERLRNFIDRKFDDLIVVAVAFDSKDGRFSGAAMQAFNSAITSTLKNNTYLEVKGGKRLFLEAYQAPSNDGLGAKFIFPRIVEGQPFIKPESGEVRFYSEIAGSLKLNMRFKVADMIYDGQLEY